MLIDKVIVIAGGSGLIGKELTKALLAKNARVVVLDNCPIRKWKQLKINGPEFIQTDITSKESILKAIKRIQLKFNKIDAFVNSAYPRNKNYGRHFFEVEYEDFVENVGMHLGGYFLTAQLFAKYFMKQGHGNIISFASIQGVIAPKFEIYKGTDMTSPVEYSAIKAGIIHLTKYMAKYLKGSNIRINCISPGGILDNQPKKFLKAYKNYCTTKGMLGPSDLNGTLIYLLSDMSCFVNGQNIVVDDGFTL